MTAPLHNTNQSKVPCPKGCGATIHPENTGFHVCIAKERGWEDWGDAYNYYLRLGCDNGDAAYRADAWEKRSE